MELQFCLTVARRYELDPFQKQIWFVRRWDSEALQTNGKKGGYIWTPQVSIDGLCVQAATYHVDYGSFSEPEYGPMMEIKWQWNGEGPFKTLLVPEWCRMESWKKGASHCTVAKLWWEEIYPSVDYAPLVRRLRRHMLAKCVKANLVRTDYPKKTGGLLIPEECQNPEFTDFTPGGRLVSRTQPTLESGSTTYDLAVQMAQSETKSTVPFKQRVEVHQQNLSRLTPAQVEVVKAKQAPEIMKTEYVDPEKSKCPECGSSFGVHLIKCSKFKKPGEAVAAIFYVWFDQAQKAKIVPGPAIDSLTADVKALLRKHWDQAEKAVMLDAEAFEAVKFELEKRKIPLRRVREPGEDA